MSSDLTHKIGLKEIICSLGSWRIKIIKIADYLCGSLLAFVLPSRKEIPPNLPSTERILIIRPGGIGDAVFLIPFLRLLKEKYPAYKIDILCERRNLSVFELANNLVHQIYCYDSMSSFRQIFRNRYDIVMDTEQWHYLSGLVAYFLNPKNSIGFATRPLRAKLFNSPAPYEVNEYEIINFQKLFKVFFNNNEEFKIKNTNACITLPADLTAWAKQILPQKAIALFIGASIEVRRLSDAQCKTIIEHFLKKNKQVVLLGGKDVINSGDKIEKEFNNNKVINFVGKTTLAQSAALIQQCEQFIGTDSGLLHLACAVGTPVTGIFGPGNLKKWAPQGNNHAIITKNVSCSPCTHFGYTIPTCKGSYHCMKDLELDKYLL